MQSNQSQATNTLLMIRPARFGFNAETAASNAFQQKSLLDKNEIQRVALEEFDVLVKKLRSKKIYVIVLQDDGKSETPDAVFPNNWISFQEKKIILYPMMAASRRPERKQSWIHFLKHAVIAEEVIDFSSEENHGKFLEGTGSIVLDHKSRIAFANLSSRTNENLLKDWCMKTKFEMVVFRASTKDGREIYHTNVMMAIGERVAVICSEVIRDSAEKKAVLKKLSHNRRVVEITEEQMHHFCGNLLLVKNREGKNFWVMSESAFNSFTEEQKQILRSDGELLFCNLKMIETVGGGSARCMMAEIF
ncbi:MAG: citrulline utilization hydrolase CtlX [Chitinophagales bacterium]